MDKHGVADSVFWYLENDESHGAFNRKRRGTKGRCLRAYFGDLLGPCFYGSLQTTFWAARLASTYFLRWN